MLSSRLRPHLLATGLLLGFLTIGYGTIKGALMIKGWMNATPRLQHQEMEDFLMYKEMEARLKAVKAQ